LVTLLTRGNGGTRAQLLDAALRVFLRRGFHAASLDEIAEEAGYTTGAVYSNFKGKEDLFLAVLDAEAQRRFPLRSALMLDAPSIEEGLRASAREMAQYAPGAPGVDGRVRGVLDPCVAPARAAPEGRRAARALLDTVGGLVAEWASRWGVEFKLPAREVVHGT
jgi:AcrR family transcriptional regulator